MIRIQLKKVLAKKKRSLYWLAMTTGIHYASLWRIAEEQIALVSLETLDRICEALDCEAGDILMRVRRKKSRTELKKRAQTARKR